MKKIWIVNEYGPIEGENWRDYRDNQFGKILAANGYDTVWWTANFAHHFKKYRSDSWKDIKVCDGYKIRLVPTTSYKKNFGIGRWIKDISFSIHVKKDLERHNKPDLIIFTYNSMTFGGSIIKYAKKNQIPLINDQMDLWPEFIENHFSAITQKLIHALLKPFYKSRERHYKKFNGIIALGSNYLNKALELSGNLPNALIYNGINVTEFRSMMNAKCPPLIINDAEKQEGWTWCVFAGTLGPSYDIKTIVDCAEICKKNRDKIRFIIAGSGSETDMITRAAVTNNLIVYLGYMAPEQLLPLYSKCDIGLNAYSAASNVDMPDKFYDYTAAGLAVVNSLTKEVKDYITKQQLGSQYQAGNAESLYAAITDLIQENRLKKAKEKSFAIASYFDMNMQCKKLISIIEQILSENMEESNENYSYNG